MKIVMLVISLFLTACSKEEKINSYYAEKFFDAYITSQKIKNPKDITTFLKMFEDKSDVPYREIMISCIQDLEADPSDMSDILTLFRDVMPLSEEALMARYPNGIDVTETAFASHFEIQNKCLVNENLYIFD